jgi:hypothetical protein
MFSSIEKIQKLARRFELILIKQSAQQTSAQAADVEDALRSANLFDISDKVSPLINAAKIPDDASVNLSMTFDRALNPSYIVQTNPPSPAANTLSGLLKKHFAGPMKQALIQKQLNIADTINLNWLKF